MFYQNLKISLYLTLLIACSCTSNKKVYRELWVSAETSYAALEIFKDGSETTLYFYGLTSRNVDTPYFKVKGDSLSITNNKIRFYLFDFTYAHKPWLKNSTTNYSKNTTIETGTPKHVSGEVKDSSIHLIISGIYAFSAADVFNLQLKEKSMERKLRK